MSTSTYTSENLRVNSPNVTYSDAEIHSVYEYGDAQLVGNVLTPKSETIEFKTSTAIGKVGFLMVGWGGNNGSTVTGGVLANKLNLRWHTKEGLHHPDYLGSITRSTTMRVGIDEQMRPVHAPLHSLVPLLHPNDIEIWGWDISGMNLGDALLRSQVFEYDLVQQLYPLMKEFTPWPSVYIPGWVAANQDERADNVLRGTLQEMLEVLRGNIRDFKAQKNLDSVIVLWTANTEKYCVVRAGLNDTPENLLAAIRNNSPEVSPSTLFAVASILEDCTYINGSPQNTLVPGLVQMALNREVLIAGDDFKSGQTKFKSVMTEFLVNSGLKLQSVVSYNHLGNNDGKNLTAPDTFRSKELSKSGVIDDVVRANRCMYGPEETPDHCVVIKYVPYVGDSKRALDEYVSEIFMGGKNTIVLHNTCEDSLLAAPIILDLVVLAELCNRVMIKVKSEEFTKMHSVLSLLSFLLKSPMVPEGSPVVHSLFPQRYAIINFLKALVGLPPENFMMLEHKVPSMMKSAATK